jgi:hypothetical protein
MDDVRRCSVLFSELGQLFLQLLVLLGPALAVLRLEDVVLGVVDDLLSGGGTRRDEPCDGQHRRISEDSHHGRLLPRE